MHRKIVTGNDFAGFAPPHRRDGVLPVVGLRPLAPDDRAQRGPDRPVVQHADFWSVRLTLLLSKQTVGRNVAPSSPVERERMRQGIAMMESRNARCSPVHSTPSERAVLQQVEASFAHLPPLPSWLNRPEYLARPNVICPTDDALDFFLACEQGQMQQMTLFVETQIQSQAHLQYGLERASFGNQPEAARYLLNNGTNLHSNVFERFHDKNEYLRMTIFDVYPEEGSLILLLQVFIDFGWHPNQAWTMPFKNAPGFPLCCSKCIQNRPLARFLLLQGADPKLGPCNGIWDGTTPVDRDSDRAFTAALSTCDITLLKELIMHGVNPHNACPLSSLVSRNLPFSQRRETADYVLSLDGNSINKVQLVHIRAGTTEFPAQPRGTVHPETALSKARALGDDEYAEWLLEKGADPEISRQHGKRVNYIGNIRYPVA
ncbi:hypothetical protein QQS21_001922 [Conoideocrella luteorostrata]|uniref:Ankyrin repeat protein n=1 Tax=Conoideocrella luteorostrata TaxID=1105319 RepID=A0AAJ0FXS9_9HYPO|nr:hypothetical protein QQS21_001922 [Conoideocrella luteorostrata]